MYLLQILSHRIRIRALICFGYVSMAIAIPYGATYAILPISPTFRLCSAAFFQGKLNRSFYSISCLTSNQSFTYIGLSFTFGYVYRVLACRTFLSWICGRQRGVLGTSVGCIIILVYSCGWFKIPNNCLRRSNQLLRIRISTKFPTDIPLRTPSEIKPRILQKISSKIYVKVLAKDPQESPSNTFSRITSKIYPRILYEISPKNASGISSKKSIFFLIIFI